MIKQNDKIAFSESDTLGKSIDPIHRHFASKYPFFFSDVHLDTWRGRGSLVSGIGLNHSYQITLVILGDTELQQSLLDLFRYWFFSIFDL